MLEIGKKYMFNFKKHKGALETTELSIYKTINDTIKSSWFHPEMHHVLWVENPSHVADCVTNGKSDRVHLQAIRICRPFEGFEITEILFNPEKDFAQYLISMPIQGQEYFEKQFVTTSVTEIMADLW